MRPYESDIYKPNRELNYGNQTEIVAFDIEYITLFANIINAIEGLFYIYEAAPFAFLYILYPILQSNLWFWMLLGVFINNLLGENPHI